MATTELTKRLLEIADSPPTDISDEERWALMEAFEMAKLSLENPLEVTVFPSVTLCLAVDMKLLDLGLEAQGPITADELASGSGAASELIESIIHIASQLPPVTFLLEYLKEKGYHSPTDATNGPFQYTRKSKLQYFDWLSQRPKIQHAFNKTMAIHRVGRGEECFELSPVEERLSMRDAESSRILLVDIGGSLPASLIFEDLPAVVASASSLPPGIEGLGHGLFQPQPPSLRNAKAQRWEQSYMRTVLHDWPDKQALQILGHIREFMEKDSVLLINETIFPYENVAFYPAALDLIMMELLDKAGFRFVAMWRPKDFGPGSGTLLEAVLKE
ncbi:S-adenosyl-L-methionine-dependent methyltransferase [Lentithecium fluviatile CBS 122367]|uniref:S-adenosyl-L-methionine-dependent methyltransferase n=1 Tax=Lentithecium fluviatile CBS 122367 TaxID=1168545 RepID=A0A6G1IU04_9PLEO|nr:S-adenosyl-L-methionine-dependent methyltransferase [Lentithecium fluviatile CBS 122367]